MRKATQSVEALLKKVSAVIEVRDARSVTASANPLLQDLIGDSKPRVVVLSKADLVTIPPPRGLTDCVEVSSSSRKSLRVVAGRAMHTRKGAKHSASLVLSALAEVIQSNAPPPSPAASGADRMRAALNPPSAVVIGVPNVGKSTLINALRGSGKAAGVGALPGVTRNTDVFRVPLPIQQGKRKAKGKGKGKKGGGESLLVYDTPGVMLPSFPDLASGLKLALLGGIKDSRVPLDIMVDFLLDTRPEIDVRSSFNLPPSHADDDEYRVERLLDDLAAHRGLVRSGGVYDRDAAARIVIRAYRDGTLTTTSLDHPASVV